MHFGGTPLQSWKNSRKVGKVFWCFHTYACAGNAAVALGTNHYLLFERGSHHFCV